MGVAVDMVLSCLNLISAGFHLLAKIQSNSLGQNCHLYHLVLLTLSMTNLVVWRVCFVHFV